MLLRQTITPEQDHLQFLGVTAVATLGSAIAVLNYGIRPLLPPADNVDPLTLAKFTWLHRDSLMVSTGWWPVWLTAALIPGVMATAAILSLSQRRRRPLIAAGVGFAAGGAIGTTLVAVVSNLGFLPRLVAPPGLALVGSVFGLMLLAPLQREVLIRGARIVELQQATTRTLRRAVRKGQLVLAGAVLAPKDEGRHVLVSGATGTGKSTAILMLLEMTLARGDRHVVVDPNGLAMARFFRAGDVILNPLDPLSAAWDLLAEIWELGDYKRLAEILVPAASGHDQSWVQFARTVFACCLQRWHEVGGGTSKEFFETMAIADSQVLGPLCQGTAAESYFAESNARMLGSIMATLNQALEPMAALARVSGPSFSVRTWLREGTGTLWMPYRADQIAALRTLISSWMSLAITETLSLPPSDTRRIWFHIDELDALGPIQGLKDAVTRLRKFGGRVVMGVQSISQVRSTYGAADASTIVENCEIKLILRSAKGDREGTAAFASALLGEREVERDQITTSSSDGQHSSSSTSLGRQRVREPVVLDSEIMQLPDRTGYLKIPTKSEWMKVSF